MRTLVFEGVVTALTSVSHIGETRGINSMLRREKIAMPDATVEEIPIVSGNSLRGLLRDRGMLHMCRALDYGVNEETGEVKGLSLPAFYFLFSGGALTKDGGRGLDVDLARRMRELIPLVGVFGGAMGNQIMPGKLKTGKLIPLCQETAHLVPQRFVSETITLSADNPETNADELKTETRAKPLTSIWNLIQSEPYTRKDDEKNEGLRQLLEPDTRLQLEAKAAQTREKTRANPNAVDNEMGQHQQMRYYVETFAAGTRFYWDITLDDVTEVEFDAFAIALTEFSRKPFIGGKSAVGHGKVSVKFDSWLEIDSRVSAHGSPVGLPIGATYLKHLQTRGDDIRAELAKLA